MINYKKTIFNEFDCDVWTQLKKSQKPILIYGMGNGADKIIKVFERYGIEYQDTFASDGFVRGHFYKGKRVLSYSEACEKYHGNFDVVVSFGSRLNEVIERIYSLEEKHSVFAPDVPVCDGEIFNEEFFDSHIDELFLARSYLSDEKSKDVFDDIVRFKLSGRLSYIRSATTSESEADSILQLDKYKAYVDLGAYNGDTVKKYTELCPNLEKIYAFEPDKRNFKKLFEYSQTLINTDITCLNYAGYECDTVLEFSSAGNRNSTATTQGSFQHKTVSIEAKAPDSVCRYADFIKYDVEGLEYSALLGSKKLITELEPDLLVSMYHLSEDMYRLPILVKKLNPNYSLYLRKLPYIPAWDLNLYAIKK